MAGRAARRGTSGTGSKAPRRLGALGLLCLLAGCAATPEAPAPPEATAVAPGGPELDAPALPGALPDEAALVEFYARIQGDLTATGRLRQETAPADAPYGVPELVRDFERIALYEEYAGRDGQFEDKETPAPLRRWTGPIRVAAVTGAATPRDGARDRGNIAGFTRRLARLTGLDMAMADDPSVNFLVLVMGNAERAEFAERIARDYPTFASAVTDAFDDMPLDTFCKTYLFPAPGNLSVYSAAMIVIRAEHPPLTRLSCVQEEMAQAMGLQNDSPDARPSLFSDSFEFALLTEHDEILLRMLYDPSLRPGMTAEEVTPLLPGIARAAIAAEQRDGGAMLLAIN